MIEGKALQQRELKALSKTRWCCQTEACDAVVATLGSIVKSIEHFSHDENADRRFASQALVRIMDTDFVVCLLIFQHILRKASIVANYLQDKEIDVARAVNSISSLKDDLQRKELFNDIWGIVKRMIERFGFQPPVERRRRRCREAANEIAWTMVDYKEKLFDVVIRSFVKELNRRFSSECCTILNAMAAFFPTSADFLNTNVMRPFVNFYELRSDLLKSECKVFAVQFAKVGTNCKNLLQFYNSWRFIKNDTRNFTRHIKSLAPYPSPPLRMNTLSRA